jgi:PEP-CTERM motif-containing protein
MNTIAKRLMALTLLCSAAAHADNIVLNPGFETGDSSDWANNASANMSWAVGPKSPGGLYPNDGTYFAQTGCVGASCLAYGTSTANDLSQVLTTVPGQTYYLTFFAASTAPPGSAANELDVYWGGSQINRFSTATPCFQGQGYCSTGGAVGLIVPNGFGYGYGDLSDVYIEYQTAVLAASASTKLEFLGRDDPGYVLLDDVSVSTTVPLPASGWLMLSALGGLGFVGRKRRTEP